MLLAIDTASKLLGIALHDGQNLIADHAWYTTNQHNVELSPAIDAMLVKAGIAPGQLTAIAVAQGPGSYTGLRIGMAVAKAMALALQLPLVTVPTHDIVAVATSYYKGALYVSVQAGRGRVTLQRYRWQKGGWIQADEPFNVTWDEFLEGVDKNILVSGEIDARAQSLMATTYPHVEIVPAAQRLRRAGYLAELGYTRLDEFIDVDPALAAPIYLKKP
jgi:tRNA threonylcarbamoyladenosine biosynthesis protein TsaB